MSVSLFANDGVQVVERKITVDDKLFGDVGDLEEFFEISRCVGWINEHGFKVVALQFPDELLRYSVEISSRIKRRTRSETYILADTSYGCCCVDEVAAEHVDADCIIHYGHSCLSPTKRLPVLFIFGKRNLNVKKVEEKFKQLFPEEKAKILILSDVIYDYAVDNVVTSLKLIYTNLTRSPLIINSCAVDGKTVEKLSRIFPIDYEDFIFFYIGHDDQSLATLILTFNKNIFYSYDPATDESRKENLTVNRTLSKRYYLVERTRDANIIGILVGTLGVADYLTVINRLKKIIKKSGKKVYTLAMGKINVAKLANFPEIDVFVLVACPENSLIDSKEFFRPVVTPFEVEIACNPTREWLGNFEADFRQLLPGASNYIEIGEIEQPEEPTVSLLTGQMRKSKLIQERCDDLVSTDGSRVVAPIHQNGAGEFLVNRSWTGLQRDLGETKVSKFKIGRSGNAISYENEVDLYK